MVAMPTPRPFHFVLVALCCWLSSCSGLVTNSVIEPAIGNLQQQTDIDLVCDGAPAYLLKIDSMLVSSPDSRNEPGSMSSKL